MMSLPRTRARCGLRRPSGSHLPAHRRFRDAGANRGH